MKSAILLLSLSFTALAAVTEFKDSSSYSMSAPELLTSTRFAYVKENEGKHLGNKFAHGRLVIVEKGVKHSEQEIKGCGRPQRLNASTFMVSGCRFVSIFDFDGNKLLERETIGDFAKNQAVALNDVVYIAGNRTSVTFDLKTRTERKIECGRLPLEYFYKGDGKVFGHNSISIYEVRTPECKFIQDGDSVISNLAHNKGLLALHFADNVVTIMTFDMQNLNVLEGTAGPDNSPVVTAKPNVYPAANGGFFVFQRTVTPLPNRGWGGWYPRTPGYHVTFNLKLIDVRGKVVRERFIDNDKTVVSLTPTAGKHLVMISNEDENNHRTVELIDGTSLNTAWKVHHKEIDATQSFVQSEDKLIGNRGEVLNIRTGEVVHAPRVTYAKEDVPSVLDPKTFMTWNYRSSKAEEIGQWQLQYFQVSE